MNLNQKIGLFVMASPFITLIYSYITSVGKESLFLEIPMIVFGTIVVFAGFLIFYVNKEYQEYTPEKPIEDTLIKEDITEEIEEAEKEEKETKDFFKAVEKAKEAEPDGNKKGI